MNTEFQKLTSRLRTTRHSQARGFVILFTILISAIILMIGLGIFSVATRETVLSGTAREAQAAFYAADAGVECALYAQSLPGGGPFSTTSPGGTFSCGSTGGFPNQVSVNSVSPFEFYISIGSGPDATCSHVTVIESGTERKVVAQGYNLCDSAGHPAKNPLLVERDLYTSYDLATVPASTTGAGTAGPKTPGGSIPVSSGTLPSLSGTISSSPKIPGAAAASSISGSSLLP